MQGWALYAEALGEECGLYTTPYEKWWVFNFNTYNKINDLSICNHILTFYSRLGRYFSELLRATRLVVDTGMHHKRWTTTATPSNDCRWWRHVMRFNIAGGRLRGLSCTCSSIRHLPTTASSRLSNDTLDGQDRYNNCNNRTVIGQQFSRAFEML